MISTVHCCGKCSSPNIVKNGHNQSGTPQYKCKDCGTCRVLKSKQATAEIDIEAVYRTYEERNSLRSTGRIFDISHTTVLNLLKKKAKELPPFKTTIEQPPFDKNILEVDEVFTFISLKTNKIRIWIVQNRTNRQILSFFIGDGTMASCKRLWRKIPAFFLKSKSFSDFWRSYNCLPSDTHTKVGKDSGETNHIERLNNTIRQRFGRMVRKSLSFSKKEYMLNLHFKLWAYQYNLNLNVGL